MSIMTAAQWGDAEFMLPTDSGERNMTTLAVSTAAANLNLNGTWSSVANRLSLGGNFVVLEAQTANCYVLAKATATTAAATTVTGTLIEAGTRDKFWVTSKEPILDVVADATGTLKVYVCRNTSKD